VRFVRGIFALLLAALWPAVTSHALLEQAGVIHQVHAEHHHPHHGPHEHNSDNHDFADGKYWAKTSGTKTPKPNFALAYQCAWLAAPVSNLSSTIEATDAGPGPPGTAPPELLRPWNFLLRAAANPRAPTFTS